MSVNNDRSRNFGGYYIVSLFGRGLKETVWKGTTIFLLKGVSWRNVLENFVAVLFLTDHLN